MVEFMTGGGSPAGGLDQVADDDRRIELGDFQQLIRNMYLEKDIARGVDGTFMWLMEEIGELGGALRKGTHEQRLDEFADVLAWLATIANVIRRADAAVYVQGVCWCNTYTYIVIEYRRAAIHLQRRAAAGQNIYLRAWCCCAKPAVASAAFKNVASFSR